MRLRLLTYMIVGVLGWIPYALAEVEEAKKQVILKNIVTVSVQLKDDVKNQCWTNINAIRSIIEAAFIREGLKLVKDAKSDAYFSLSANGFSIFENKKFGCSIKLSADLKIFGKTVFLSGPEDDVWTITSIWSRGGIMYSGDQTNGNDLIRSSVDDWISELIAEILKARQSP